MNDWLTEMQTEKVRRRCETINFEEEDVEQVVHVVMADQKPEPEQCEERLADCLIQHDEDIIL